MTIEITEVASPVYVKADNSAINCTVTLSNGEVVPFTATGVDPEPHGQQLWADLNNGKYGAIAPYVAP